MSCQPGQRSFDAPGMGFQVQLLPGQAGQLGGAQLAVGGTLLVDELLDGRRELAGLLGATPVGQ